MKKLLLFLFVMGPSLGLYAQIIFNVSSPESLSGNYAMTYVNWALTPDLAVLENAVTGELAVVNDGSANPELGCLELTNAAAIAGKIAVIRRGDCQFGVKALNANNAGAIAVVIVNNVPGTPVGMAAGDVGDQVTIPVVMITQEAGDALISELATGSIEVFIGNKTGLYNHDLGFYPEDIYLPDGFSIPSRLSENGTEFNYTPACWIHNYGGQATEAAMLTVTITHDGNVVYTGTSGPLAIGPDSEVYASTPNFAPASYLPGLYDVSYEVTLNGDFTVTNYVETLEIGLDDVGSGYISANNVATTSTGSGTGLTLNINAAPINTVTALDEMSLVPGTGYVDSMNVSTSTDNAGVGLTVDVTAVAGGVTGLTINQAGSGYTIGDVITVNSGDSTATIVVSDVEAGGQIISYTLNNLGNGYNEEDSIFVTGGNGDAILVVAAVASEVEQYDGDNTYNTGMYISEKQIFSRATVDENGDIQGGPAFQLADGAGFSACINFTHPNASRLGLHGLHFGATANAPNEIGGEVLQVAVWKYDNNFTSLLDPVYNTSEAIPIAADDFDIPVDAENGEILFAEITNFDGDFIVLEDNARYLFCVGTQSPDVFILFDGGGLDNRRQYEEANGLNQPDYNIITSQGIARFEDFYGMPAIGADFFDVVELGLTPTNSVDVTPYPNPTTEFLFIPLKDLNGKASLEIFDANGRLMSANNVVVVDNKLKVDVKELSSGMYTFNMAFENGKITSFKVMVTK
jgi:hypothetical protein